MKIDLTPQLESMLREKVETGLYENVADVVRDALVQMQARDEKERIKAARLLQAVDEGLKDVAEGRYDAFATKDDLDTFFKSL